MTCEQNGANKDSDQAKSCQSFLWRPWPCSSCRGRTTPARLLLRSIRTGSPCEIARDSDRNQIIDAKKKWESEQLLKWVETCPHTSWLTTSYPKLAEGSEHLVLFDENTGEVVKITRPGTYGDYYEIIRDQIHQFDNVPLDYLMRLWAWELFFSEAPRPIGITKSGGIISRQRFIVGRADPPQDEVDEFLLGAGAVPVRQNCWLWKKEVDAELEIWIGDARSDNFVHAEEGIVPIDIRIWGVLKDK